MFRRCLGACIAFGLCCGVLSCTFFLWRSVARNISPAALWLVLAGYTALAMVVYRKLPLESTRPPIGSRRILSIAFLLVCCYAAWLFFIRSWNYPQGAWDAWAIWNLHARFLFRGGDQWFQMFSRPLYWTHPDYPLLLPSLIAVGWTLAGKETILIPVMVSFVFTFATVGLLTSSVSYLWNDRRGIAAGLLLLATPDFFLNGSSQLADVPLGFFILLTTVLLYLYDERDSNTMLLLLAGTSAALAAWTKNEGLLFVLAAIVVRLLVSAGPKPVSIIPRELCTFAYGLLPILALTLTFKFWLAPPNDIFSFVGLGERLKDSGRYAQIGRHFLKEMAVFGAPRLSPFCGLIAYLVYAPAGKRSRTSFPQSGFPLLTFMLAGYFFVYVISVQNLQWQLTNSFSRLIVQLWPTFLFCTACADIRRSRHSG